MNLKTVFLAAACAGALALPAGAQAQDDAGEGFVVASAGIHSLGFEDEVQAVAPGFEVSDSSPIIGVAAGFDFPLGSSAFAGFEGNYHFGTDALDSDYGASVRLGFRAEGGTKLYVRGGYQEINVDYNKIIQDDSVDFSGVDDSEGDYLVGVGVDVPAGGIFFRGNVDTISFDTLRATAGIGVRF
jgi:outer membrane immunogenic protein